MNRPTTRNSIHLKNRVNSDKRDNTWLLRITCNRDNTITMLAMLSKEMCLTVRVIRRILYGIFSRMVKGPRKCLVRMEEFLRNWAICLNLEGIIRTSWLVWNSFRICQRRRHSKRLKMWRTSGTWRISRLNRPLMHSIASPTQVEPINITYHHT